MKKHLLLVDDEAAVWALAALDLHRSGYEVTTSATIEEAIGLLEHNRFHLLITDLLLPSGDGLVLLDIVKDRHPSLPVVILTGMGFDDATMHEAFAKGAKGFVSKGLTMSHLRLEIARVLKQAESDIRSVSQPLGTASSG